MAVLAAPVAAKPEATVAQGSRRYAFHVVAVNSLIIDDVLPNVLLCQKTTQAAQVPLNASLCHLELLH